VIGVDPAAAMLAYARRQDGADHVRWIEGNSSALGSENADLVLMTGNVSQVFLDDASLAIALHDIHAALQPGGHLAFESRNPADQPWLRWNREATFTTFDSPHGPVETWLDVETSTDEIVHLVGWNHFLNTGQMVIARETLRFRSAMEWVAALDATGFAVERSHGDWENGPLLAFSPIMVFVARRA
jgi:SAM-dependent methyltransferase